MKIAYLGIPGSYSHTAARKYFTDEDTFIGNKTFSHVFRSVADASCDVGIVALENSIHGSVVEVYDGLEKYKLSIIGELFLQINHCLLTRTPPDSTLSSITTCLSHPQAIGQCEAFFEAHPWIESSYTTDTASAAKEVSLSNRTDISAISSKTAAEIYGLTIVKEHLANNRNNFTRFAIISPTPNVTGEKISLSFSLAHTPGSLLKALTPYATYGLNLMKVESRPIPEKPWEYTFFVDMEVGNDEEKIQTALREMKLAVSELTTLGRYSKGKIYEA